MNFKNENLKMFFKNNEIHSSDKLPDGIFGHALAKDIRRSHAEKLDLASYAWALFFYRYLIQLPADWELPFVSSYSEPEDNNLQVRKNMLD